MSGKEIIPLSAAESVSNILTVSCVAPLRGSEGR